MKDTELYGLSYSFVMFRFSTVKRVSSVNARECWPDMDCSLDVYNA